MDVSWFIWRCGVFGHFNQNDQDTPVMSLHEARAKQQLTDVHAISRLLAGRSMENKARIFNTASTSKFSADELVKGFSANGPSR